MIARRIGCFVAAACLAASSLGAQSDTAPSPAAAFGQRVMVATHHGQWRVGLLVGADSANLGILLDGRRDTTWLTRSAVTEMMVSTGRQSYAREGAEVGLFAGLIAGAVIAVHNAPSCTPHDILGLDCTGNTIDNVGRGFVGVLVGATTGAAAGALLGWLVKTERWERVPIKS